MGVTVFIREPYVEQVQKRMMGCRDEMHHAKNRGNKEIPLALLSTCTVMCNPLPEYMYREGLHMIVLVSSS